MRFPRDFCIEKLTLVTQYFSLQQKRYPLLSIFFPRNSLWNNMNWYNQRLEIRNMWLSLAWSKLWREALHRQHVFFKEHLPHTSTHHMPQITSQQPLTQIKFTKKATSPAFPRKGHPNAFDFWRTRKHHYLIAKFLSFWL